MTIAGATLLAYIIAGVFFILTLRGLSSPESARRGNQMGVLGMAIAVATTLTSPVVQDYTWIFGGLLVGGVIGYVIAKKIEMTALPQLVAAFHSLVGMAAVLVATSAMLAPENYGIGVVGEIAAGSLVEMSLGLAIGAITFSGSVIAFAKLQGLMSGNPLVFKGQHFLNAALGISIVVLIVLFCRNEDHMLFFAVMAVSFLLGFLLILPIGGADMPVVVSMLTSYSGWAAAGIGFT
jgi:NAD(P) transhydrogenase subunit beta